MSPTRGTSRRALGSGLLALAGLAAAAPTRAKPMAQAAASPANAAKTSLHQEVAFKAPPARVYDLLLNAKAFGALTGTQAVIDPRVGGQFKLFDGQVDGVNIELTPGVRVVQAWRPIGDFAPGVYSLVHFELTPKAGGTLVKLDHTGFPPGHYDHLFAGWPPHYWEPMRKVLG
jgi:uncharacterized protein YndB with AHSA1/START domain